MVTWTPDNNPDGRFLQFHATLLSELGSHAVVRQMWLQSRRPASRPHYHLNCLNLRLCFIPHQPQTCASSKTSSKGRGGHYSIAKHKSGLTCGMSAAALLTPDRPVAGISYFKYNMQHIEITMTLTLAHIAKLENMRGAVADITTSTSISQTE